MSEVLGLQAGASVNSEVQVIDTTVNTFRQDVLAESSRQPVLVDFWAPWCQPCKQLEPVLRKVVTAAGSKVRLVRMNIEEHPQIAGQLGIKSIPAVVAFQKGQPVDGFAGALPESQVRGFVERLVGPISGQTDGILAEADAHLAAGETQAAISKFEIVAALEPENTRALAGLARGLIDVGRLKEARALLGEILPDAKEPGVLAAARAALELAEQASQVGDFDTLEKQVDANPADYEARFNLALAYNAGGRKEQAAEALLEIIQRDRKWNEDGARKQLLQFFEAWGPVDPDTVTARRRLSAILFS